jgi:hypothetical protein
MESITDAHLVQDMPSTLSISSRAVIELFMVLSGGEFMREHRAVFFDSSPWMGEAG